MRDHDETPGARVVLTHPAHSRLVLLLRLAQDACRELGAARQDTTERCVCDRGGRPWYTCPRCTLDVVGEDARNMEYTLGLYECQLHSLTLGLPAAVEELSELLGRWHAEGEGDDIAEVVLAGLLAVPEVREAEGDLIARRDRRLRADLARLEAARLAGLLPDVPEDDQDEADTPALANGRLP
jgi:hypothetical protein